MKGKIRKTFFILTVGSIFSYVLYKYYNFKTYIDIYNNEAMILVEKIEDYSIMRWDNIPNNTEDFNNMIESFVGINEVENLLKYGINYEYDSKDKSLKFYSFGVDKKDNNLTEKLVSTSDPNYAIFGNNIIDNWNFYDVFFSSGKDVLLFELIYEEDYLCKNFINSGLSKENLLVQYARSYVFFSGNKKITGNLVNQLKDSIRPYKYLINPDPRPILNDSSKISFVRFKNGNFYSVCSEDINLNIFDNKLKRYLVDNNIDYAVIPMIISKTD